MAELTAAFRPRVGAYFVSVASKRVCEEKIYSLVWYGSCSTSCPAIASTNSGSHVSAYNSARLARTPIVLIVDV